MYRPVVHFAPNVLLSCSVTYRYLSCARGERSDDVVEWSDDGVERRGATYSATTQDVRVHLVKQLMWNEVAAALSFTSLQQL